MHHTPDGAKEEADNEEEHYFQELAVLFFSFLVAVQTSTLALTRLSSFVDTSGNSLFSRADGRILCSGRLAG